MIYTYVRTYIYTYNFNNQCTYSYAYFDTNKLEVLNNISIMKREEHT